MKSHSYCRGWFSVAVVAGIVLAVLLGLRFLYTQPTKLRFRLDAKHQRDVIAVNWSWWNRLIDLIQGRRYIVLTFDDGPAGGGIDEDILSTLRHYNAKALFFFVCSRITPDREHILREIQKSGSIIGDHSYTHPHLRTLDSLQLRHQIVGCKDYLRKLDGVAPRYFRPPFGETSNHIEQVERAAHLRQMLWSANSFDVLWHRPSVITQWALREAHNRAILLMHSRRSTAKALPQILRKLRRAGYRFVLPNG